ncbi:unnamed protein product [Mycena citricolor]|uniref:Ubiquitin-like protease family profile domain-containing protein n=1 Tax=Mycena citricolor TaxID=2018698 RepID=A0AAD2GXJ7_9AGAR|nr:unnamed protein product [Mycena citricolor]
MEVKPLIEKVRNTKSESKDIARIREQGSQQWLDGANSITYKHVIGDAEAASRYPLWVLVFWERVHEIRKIRSIWSPVQKWVQERAQVRKSPEVRAEAKKTLGYLAEIPWNRGKRGLSDHSPMHTMYRFLRKTWLSSTDVDDILELLRDQIAGDQKLLEKYIVEGVNLADKIQQVFSQAPASSQDYEQSANTRWISAVGSDVFELKQTLLTVVHLGTYSGEKHWVGIEVDGEADMLRYGDSLGHEAPTALTDAFRWWASQHGLSDLKIGSFEKISKQTDGDSCGFFACDTVFRAAFPDAVPLEQSDFPVPQLEMFNHLVARSLDGIADERASTFIEAEDICSSDGSDDGTEDLPPQPRSFSKLAQSAPAFTFECQSPSKPQTVMEDDVSELRSSMSGISLKRERGNPDALTPAPSPSKKRVQISHPTPRDPPLPINLPTAHSNEQPVQSTSALADVFQSGKAGMSKPAGTQSKVAAKTKRVTNLSDDEGPQPSVRSFFKRITREEKDRKTALANEKFRSTRESKSAEIAEANFLAKKDKRERNRLSQAKSRANKKALAIASGIETGKKRKAAVLRDYDDDSDINDLAEVSRPARKLSRKSHADAGSSKPKRGRKPKHTGPPEDAKRVNWQHPLIWPQLVLARKRAGSWSPIDIWRQAQLLNKALFKRLAPQTIGTWIESSRGISHWSESCLARVAKGNAPGGQSTRSGILDSYPVLIGAIRDQINDLRDRGAPLTLVSIRAVMVALIEKHQPNLFSCVAPDNSSFKCSDSFVRKFLRNFMGFSQQRATRAAQKIPENVDRILEIANLREALLVRDYNIPAALRVNSDQTQIVYQQGTKTTWSKRGAKQVNTVGMEEKRAFTLFPSIAADGTLLPMQAIFSGKTTASCPHKNAPRYDEASKLGFRFEPSGNGTYWSTHTTMHSFVDNILAPHFEDTKARLKLPETQYSLWKIDCWSVHRSDEFLTWMKASHPRILICFVPGGCTGLFQPLDVGVQRVMKHAMKLSAHEDVVAEASSLLRSGALVGKLYTTVTTLRDRCVGWIIDAFHACNDRELVQKAFEMCRAGDFNSSHASLTSPKMLEILRELPRTDPEASVQITSTEKRKKKTKAKAAPESDLEEKMEYEDEEEEEDFPDEEEPDTGHGQSPDESDVPLAVVRNVVLNPHENLPEGYDLDDEGRHHQDGCSRGGEFWN